MPYFILRTHTDDECKASTIMPRKNRTPATSIQNRENQRRSRARHRAFVEDLQKRLHEYERRGVEASLELQQIARGVARENAQLRALLARHGVAHEEIGRFLASSGWIDGDGCPNQPTTSQPGCLSSASEPTLDAPYRAVQGRSGHPNPAPADGAASAAPALLSPAPSPSQSHFANENVHVERNSSSSDHRACILRTRLTEDSGGSVRKQSKKPGNEVGQLFQGCQQDGVHIAAYAASSRNMSNPDMPMDILPPVSDCYCPPSSPVLTPKPMPGLETSCETAAGILLGLRGHGDDSAQVRAAMGCVGTGDCLVPNTRLFQLMEEAS
ncbi:hypothetical protein SPI_00411 [Niveomyces insectorum RCEF 264]|uniref:Bzip transcription factor n=1 Tax=Niveomyces insectorum RCEF 264 TaxID=1081102 RepID=A0A168A412_9HYPO|nr:hypothetical protein SPI_00411 [Niveomyces insectorum RCEF 264]